MISRPKLDSMENNFWDDSMLDSMENMEEIVDNILSEKTVILLGPNANLASPGQPLQESFLKVIKEKYDLIVEHDRDFLVTFKKTRDKFRFISLLRKFYQQLPSNHNTLRKLVRIPWNLLISVNPDLTIKQAFVDQGIPHEFRYYDKNTLQEGEKLEPPTKDFPLIYNLFGSIEEQNSLILTHDDLFDFIFSILGNQKKLPDELLRVIHDAKLFIFLGFEFDQWYLKLMLKLFGLNSGDNFGIAPGGNHGLSTHQKQFFDSYFHIEFVSEGIADYIDKLYDCFEQTGATRKTVAKQTTADLETSTTYDQSIVERVLRKVKSLLDKDDRRSAFDALNMINTDATKHKIIASVAKTYISENKLIQAIQLLKQYFLSFDTEGFNELVNEIIMQESRYNGLKKGILDGTISGENKELLMNKVRRSLLETVEESLNA